MTRGSRRRRVRMLLSAHKALAVGAPLGSGRMQWTTGVVARSEQFTYWRELICAAFLDLTPESRLRDGFRGTVTQFELGRLDLARIDSQAQQVRRTDDDINRSPHGGHYAHLQL